MQRLLLVNTNTEKAPYPVPPVGLCLLASALKDRYQVKVYDGVFDEGRNLLSEVTQFNPDFIGFSIRNIDDVVMDRAVFYPDEILEKFIRPVKEITKVPLILGGSGFSIFPGELMEMTGADFGITSEAEEILPLLLDRLSSGKDTSDIAGIIAKGKTSLQPGPSLKTRGYLQKNFAETDRWIDFTPYLKKGVYSIQTKRGCSHRCVYCNYPVIEGRSFRLRTPSDITDEIEQAAGRLGPVTFEFVDSTFNDPAGHAESVCREIIGRGLRVRLRTMGINPRNVSEELFGLMLRAGFVQIDATPDSASPVMLKNLDKGFELPEIKRMAELIQKFDIPTMWFFLFGGPGENEQTFGETVRFIDNYVNKSDLVYMNAGLRIYPGTPLYKIALTEGRFPENSSLFYPPVYYFPERFPKEQLEQMIAEVSSSRPNCIPSLETAPSAGMIAEAMELRRAMKLDEPMFRSLLRVRADWMARGLYPGNKTGNSLY